MLSLLAIKGIMTLLATKGIAILAVKAALAFGVAATIKTLLVAGVVVGGITWTSEMVQDVKDIINALEAGNEGVAVIRLAKLAKRLHGVNLEGLADFPQELGAYLEEVGADAQAVKAIVDFTSDNLDNIKKNVVHIKNI
jgi:hypothetical protein